MSTNTATVETLTAEVRVLMVGSRQVTMSVYKQLDYGDAKLIELFGRVRVSTTNDSDRIELVGRNGRGELVKSSIPRKPPPWTRRGNDVFTHWAFHKGLTKPNSYVVHEDDPYSLRWIPNEETYSLSCYKLHRRNDLEWPKYDPNDEGRPNRVERYNWLQAEQEHRWKIGEFCHMDNLREQVFKSAHKEFLDVLTDQELHDEVLNLPLIVLAGLR